MSVIRRDECADCGEPMRADRLLCPRNSEHIGRVTVEYVPRTDADRGAVAITDERIELAAKRLRLEYGWKTGDPDHTYRAIAKAMLEDAFGGQSE